MMNRKTMLFLVALSFISCKSNTPDYSTWATYAGTKDGNRYSSNDQITINNVSRLEVAWTYATGDKDPNNRSEIQCNPIVIDNILYAISPRLKLLALDAASGDPKWVFDPAIDDPNSQVSFGINRGVVYWQDEKGANGRILYGVDSKLYAVNASDGKLIKNFGDNGSIDLLDALDKEGFEAGSILSKTPGVIYKNLLIVGSSVSEGIDALPGHIMAFDVITGKRAWIFHTIPQPGEFGYDTWEDKDAWKKIGGANNWAGMSLDEEKGIVYVPTGSASPDFYGGNRKGSNLFANSIIALNAGTGEYIWHYQVVHHDLWDRDLPANPNLVTVNHKGKKIDALAQITKQGYIYLLDRSNGEPIFPIPEVPVPQEALPGEKPWPTQPIPTLPEPFSRLDFGPEQVSDINPETHSELMERYLQIKHRTAFTPPSKEGGWIFPDFGGGGEWGGAAVDMETQILYVNSNEVPSSLVMIDAPKNEADHSIYSRGNVVYNTYCISCHGVELKGSGSDYPSLVDLNKRFDAKQLRQIVENGRNRMPSFKQISESEKKNLFAFLLKLTSPSNQETEASKDSNRELNLANTQAEDQLDQELPYLMTGYNRFVDKNGYPGNKPPWGTLNAVNLNSGKLLWKVPLGEYEELTKQGIPITGTRNYGGPVVTKGGVIFIAATLDEKIRAFDKNTGKMLWEAQLPAAGYATPTTYMVNGKQYLVIACGGGKLGTKSGDTYVAFALPD
jgi:quinoprotein glucose dehydrogenase